MSVPKGQRDFRELVVRAVHRCADGRTFLSDALRVEFERRDFPAHLRGAATEAASGIVRRRITLDHLIARCSDRRLERIEALLLDILRLAVYEILFVEQIGVHASVSEAVELTKRVVRAEFAGFANGVLRALSRTIESVVPLEGAFVPSARELLAGCGRVVRFTEEVFPDPARDVAGYLAAAGGMPHWLIERWQRNFAETHVFQIVEASNARPPLSVRANTLRTTAKELAEELRRAGVETSPGGVEGSLRVESPVELTALEAFNAGAFYIQDTAAMLAPLELAPVEGEKVLDLCAAPGGKTTHLAELSGDRAEICALDRSQGRLGLLEENTRRLGMKSIRTCAGDACRVPEGMCGAFDAVLADVPCSNTGVLRRRVEARHRLRDETIGRLARVQAEILRTALAAAKPGGRVVYSTCSLEPEENGELVRRVLEGLPQCRLLRETLVLPRTEGSDGAYVARLVC